MEHPDPAESEPFEEKVDGEDYLFLCRLFGDEDEANAVYREVTELTAETWLSAMLIAEPTLGEKWGILLFGTDRNELERYGSVLDGRGTPYRSQFMVEAAQHRKWILDTKGIAEGLTTTASALEDLPIDRLR